MAWRGVIDRLKSYHRGMTNEQRKSTAELMALVTQRWSELEKLVSDFSAGLRERPGSSGWTLKDHLAHVAAWEKSLLALLHGEDRAGAVGVSRAEYEKLDTDGVNERIYRQHRDELFEDVIADYHATHRRVIETLNGMDDAALALPYSHYQPNDPPHNPSPVAGWIDGNTWEHYEEHIGWLRKLREEVG
jgi:hypothetical protein